MPHAPPCSVALWLWAFLRAEAAVLGCVVRSGCRQIWRASCARCKRYRATLCTTAPLRVCHLEMGTGRRLVVFLCGVVSLSVLAAARAGGFEKGVIYQQPSYYYTNTLLLDEDAAAADFRVLAAAGTSNVGLRVSIGDLISAYDYETNVATYDEAICAKLARLAGLAASNGMRLIFNTHLSEKVPNGTAGAVYHKPFVDERGVTHGGRYAVGHDIMVRDDLRPLILDFHTKFASCVAPQAKDGIKYWKHSFESCYLFPAPAAAMSAIAAKKFSDWARANNSDLSHWQTRWHMPNLTSWSDIVPPTNEGNKPFVSDYWRFWLLGVLRSGDYGLSIGEIMAALQHGAKSNPQDAFQPLLGFKHWKPHNFVQDTDLTESELRLAYDLPINVTAMGYYVNTPSQLALEPAGINSYINLTKYYAPAELPVLMWETGASTLNMSLSQQAQWASLMQHAASQGGLEGYNWWQFIDWSPQVDVPDKQQFHFGAHFVNGTAKPAWKVLSDFQVAKHL